MAQEGSKRDKEFDDVFHHIPSFGSYQKKVYFTTSFLNFLLGPQFGLLVFAMGSPRFRCTTANVTCDVNKCCNNCTSYEFDEGQFTTIVTEVSYHALSAAGLVPRQSLLLHHVHSSP